MQNELQKISDGVVDMSGGVDSGKSPSVINRNQVSFAVNAMFRGGMVRPRYPWRQIALDFGDSASLQSLFEDTRFQGAAFYRAESGEGCLVAVIGGRAFKIEIAETNEVTDLTVEGDVNNPELEKVWIEQAERWMVIQDNQSPAYIFDGNTIRRAGAGEVPIGTCMSYGTGRLWVARGREFVAGDIVGGPSGSAGQLYRDACLKFTENTYLNEGGTFTTPMSTGPITAMKFLASLDTVTGQGELVIHTKGGVYSVMVPPDRNSWKNVSEPIQRVIQLGYGSLSQFGTVNVNGDLVYRAMDGLRSLSLSESRFSRSWSNSPMSREMNRAIERDDTGLLDFSSGIVFDNRLMITQGPVYTDRGTYHQGIIVMDLDPAYSLGASSAPVYDGLWNGLNILQLVRAEIDGKEECYAFALNSDTGKIELWKMDKNQRHDNNDKKRIQWFIESPALSFQTPFELKKLIGAELFVDRLSGNVSFNVRYKQDQYPFWTQWKTWEECAKDRQCTPEEDTCITLEEYEEQYRARMVIGTPSEDSTCPVGGQRLSYYGYEFQLRIQMNGFCRLRQFRIHALEQEQDNTNEC